MFSRYQFFSIFRKSQWTQAIRRRRGELTFLIMGFVLAKDQETNRISVLESSMYPARLEKKWTKTAFNKIGRLPAS